jgi:hypothetical protein
VFPDYQNGSGALPGFYGFGGPTCKDGVKIENDTSKPAKIFIPPSSGEDPAPDPPPEYEPCDGKYCGDTFLVPAPDTPPEYEPCTGNYCGDIDEFMPIFDAPPGSRPW